MKEFFVNLKQIRESKNISLNEISIKSRLPLKYLQDIENGELENLPKGYDRIFFKRYLKEIGEDKEEVWRDFNLFFGTGPLEEDLPYSTDIRKTKRVGLEDEDEDSEVNDEKEEKPSYLHRLTLHWNLDKLHKYFWIFITVAVLSVIGYFAYQQYLFVKNSPLVVKEVSVSDYISEMQRQDSILTPQITQNTEISGGIPGNVKVALHSKARTWIREIIDNRDTTDYILIPGLIRTIEGENAIHLMLGRADGVDVWLNDDSLGVMGEADEVVLSLLLTNQGILEKRLKKVVPKKPSTSDSTEVSTQ
jgi:transcriptional regulator with XRE-family HTH domain